MANKKVDWIEELLFNKNKFEMDDTFTTFVHTAKNYKSKKYKDSEHKIVVHKGSHHLKDSYIWEQLYKQFEAIEVYLGIKAEFYENSSERYWRLVIDLRDLSGIPDFISITMKEEGFYKIKITNARRYIKAINRTLKMYLYWCMMEHKNCKKLLIIPNACNDKNGFYGFKFKESELDKRKLDKKTK